MRIEQRNRDDRRRQNFESGHREHTVRSAQEAAQRAVAGRRQVSVAGRGGSGRGGKPSGKQ